MIDSILNTLQSAAGNILQLLTYDPKAPMLFSSGLFWVLFLIFLPIYAFLKGSKWKMVTFVVCFSLYFYYKSSGIFFLMLIGTSLVDWSLSHIIYRLKIRNARLLFMWISICFSLSILGYFKYSNFFLRSEERRVGKGTGTRWWKATFSHMTLYFLLAYRFIPSSQSVML